MVLDAPFYRLHQSPSRLRHPHSPCLYLSTGATPVLFFLSPAPPPPSPQATPPPVGYSPGRRYPTLLFLAARPPPLGRGMLLSGMKGKNNSSPFESSFLS